jgi:hypothetical protein
VGVVDGGRDLVAVELAVVFSVHSSAGVLFGFLEVGCAR